MSVPVAYMTVLLVWSTTPLAITWSNESFDPMMSASFRLLISLAIMLGLRVVFRSPALHVKRYWKSYVSSALGLFPSLAFVYLAAEYLPSSLIAVLFGLTPFFVVGLSYVISHRAGVSAGQIMAILLAFLGLAIVLVSGTTVDGISIIGLVLVLLSVFVYSLSTVLVKAYSGDLDIMNQLTGALIFATPLFMFSWIIAGSNMPEQLSVKSVYAVLYLGIVGSVVAYIAYFYLLKYISAASVSLIPLLTPVLAVMLGIWLNSEYLSNAIFAGIACIFTGMWVFRTLEPKPGP